MPGDDPDNEDIDAEFDGVDVPGVDDDVSVSESTLDAIDDFLDEQDEDVSDGDSPGTMDIPDLDGDAPVVSEDDIEDPDEPGASEFNAGTDTYTGTGTGSVSEVAAKGVDKELEDVVVEWVEDHPVTGHVGTIDVCGVRVVVGCDDIGMRHLEVPVFTSDPGKIPDVLDSDELECTPLSTVLVVDTEDDIPSWINGDIQVMTVSDVRREVRGDITSDGEDATEVDTRGLGPDAGPDPDEVEPEVNAETVRVTGTLDTTLQAKLLVDQEDVETAAEDTDGIEDIDEELQPVSDGEPEKESFAALHCRIVRVTRNETRLGDTATVTVADYSGAATIAVGHGAGSSEDDIDSFEENVGDEVLLTALVDSRDRRGYEYTATGATDVVTLQSDEYPAGYYLDAPSPLDSIPSIYAESDSNGEAWSDIADAVLEEYHVAVPFSDDDEKWWMYIDSVDHDEYGLWLPDGKSRLETVLDDYLPAAKNTSHHRREILKNVKNRSRIEPGELAEGVPDDADLKWMVGVANGVVDLRTGELHDHAPHWRLRTKIQTEYDPDLVKDGDDPIDTLGDGLTWFVNDVAQSDEDALLMLNLTAHALMRNHSIKAWFPVVGPSDSGKGAFIDTVTSMLGGDVTSEMVFPDFCRGEGFETGVVRGSHIVIDDDASAKQVRDVNFLKKVTGGRGARINEKYEKLEDYTPHATVVTLNNNPSVFTEKDSSVKNRIYPIILPHRHTTEDDDNKDYIPEQELEERTQSEDELKRLLAASVQMAGKMYEAGEPISNRSEQKRWDIYQWWSDTALRFTRTCLVQETGAKLRKMAAYQTYVNFCHRDGIEPMSPTKFWTTMQKSEEISYEKGSWQDGERAVKHVMLSEDALKYAPDWVVDRYEDEIETGAATNPLDRVTPLDELAFGPTGLVEGRVIGRRLIQNGLGVKIRIQDESARRDVVAFTNEDSENPLDGVKVGDKVRLDNWTLTRYEGKPQLQWEGFGTVQVMEPGPNHSDDDQEVVSGAGETVNSSSDGGEEPSSVEAGKSGEDAARADGGDESAGSEACGPAVTVNDIGERVTVETHVGDWTMMGEDDNVHALGTVVGGDLGLHDEFTPVEMDVVAFDEIGGDAVTSTMRSSKVELRDAKVGLYDGDLQLQLDARSTVEVLEENDIGQFADWVTEDGSGGRESGEDASGKAQRDRVVGVKSLIAQAQMADDGEGASITRVINRAESEGFDESKVKHEIEKLKHQGDVYEVGEGKLRLTGGVNGGAP